MLQNFVCSKDYYPSKLINFVTEFIFAMGGPEKLKYNIIIKYRNIIVKTFTFYLPACQLNPSYCRLNTNWYVGFINKCATLDNFSTE